MEEMNLELLNYLLEAVDSYHEQRRAKILTDIYCARVYKANFEANKPGETHAWDAWIQDGENKLENLNVRYADAREFLNSLR